jgi:hypothetical protein
MTIKIESDSTYYLYSNVGELSGNSYTLAVNSLYTNTQLFTTEIELLESNERYSQFEFTPVVDLKNDVNGIYQFQIKDNENLIDVGMIKVFNPENNLPTKKYESKNETRKSVTVYRPKL